MIATNAYSGTSPITLLTRNTRDFRADRLANLGIVLMQPDIFLDRLAATQSHEVAQAVRRFRLDLASQPTLQALLDRLDRDGLRKTAQRLLAWHQSGKAGL